MKFVRVYCLFVLVLLGGSVSCSTGSVRRDKPVLRGGPMESALVKWRVVALRREGVGRCPGVDGWVSVNWLSEALRRSQTRYPEVHGSSEREVGKAISADPELRKVGLDRFCVYTLRAEGGGLPFPLDRLPEGLIDAAYSEMALVPAGVTEDVSPALAHHFIDQASGALTKDGVPLWTPRPQDRPSVRLAFLDTQQDGEGLPAVSGPSRHGYTLVHLAHQLVCRGLGKCPVELATVLALSRMHPDFPGAVADGDSRGGRIGFVDELAQAITRAVFESGEKHRDQRLILNLSVGWDEDLLDRIDQGSRSPSNPHTRLVHDALRYARQKQALVIAAAGNRRGGSESTHPVLPAAWERSRLRSRRNLIHAVGGVDWQNLPLPNSRRGGLPRLVAFGDHATVITPSGYEPASIYTGTSVSTAVVSSIAAVIWQLRPELGPAEVMKLIEVSGEELPSLADSYDHHAFRTAPHLRRVSLCAAVRQACEGGLCESPYCVLPKQAADLSPLAKDVPKNPNAPALVPAALPPGCALVTTPAPRLFVSSTSSLLNEDSGSACPLYLLPDKVSQQWVASQPDDPPCPGCTFAPPPRVAAEAPVDSGDYVLAMEVTPDWQGAGAAGAIKSAALDVDCYSNGHFTGRTTYAISQHELDQALAPAGPHLFRKGFGASLEGCTASLNFKVTLNGRTYSLQNPVYVDP